MEFEFEGTIYIEADDLQEMKRLTREGKSAEEAFAYVSSGWDDREYYLAGYIKDEVIDFITRGNDED